MSVINFHTKEIAVKIVYYGPGLCGKTTSLQTIYGSLPPERRPQIVSLATEVDRTIFFDFLPVTAYRIRDFRVRLQLYTVPGQVFYNATRKLVLNGVDGIVFVADSQTAMRDSNLESLQNLDENLADLGLDLSDVPRVLQFNKRDLPDISSIEEMDALYNQHHVPVFGTVAVSGDGLFDALRAISQMVVNSLLRKGLGKQLGPKPAAAASTPGPQVGLSDSIGAAAAAEASRSSLQAPEPQRPSMFPGSAAAPAPSPSPAPAAPLPAALQPLDLWPSDDQGSFGAKIDAALSSAHWSDATLAADELIHLVANQWGDTQNLAGSDPAPAFLLLRGLSSGRYQALLAAVQAARLGQPVERHQAMNAVIIALEAVW